MLYLVIHDTKQSSWAIDFEMLIAKGLSEVDYPYEFIKADEIGEFTEEDALFVMHYLDLDHPKVKDTKAKVITHSNGSSYNPFAYNVDRVEREQLKQVDINTTCSKGQAKYLKGKANKPSYLGFPVDIETITKYNQPKKKRKIVVGGRISPDKQFYLTAFLLEPLLEFYEIVFSVIDKDNEWSKFYDIKRFEEMGYKFHYNNQEEFYKELGDAEVFFTASLGDTICLSLVEAVLCGAYPVFPAIEKGFPFLRDYISGGYEPFSQIDILKTILGKPHIDIDLSLFDYKQVCQRLIKLLR